MRVEAAWLQLPLLLLPIQLTLLLQDLPGTALCYANFALLALYTTAHCGPCCFGSVFAEHGCQPKTRHLESVSTAAQDWLSIAASETWLSQMTQHSISWEAHVAQQSL